MNKISKWWLATGAALLVAGAVGVGAVMAQEPSTTPDATTTQDVGTPRPQTTPDPQATPDTTAPDDGGTDDGDGARGVCGVKGVSADELAAFLGITADQLRTELQADGATLATVAAAHGQDRAALIQFFTDEKAAALAERVAAGDLTQAEADEKLADFTANVDTIVDSSGLGRGHGFRGPRDGTAADTTPSGT